MSKISKCARCGGNVVEPAYPGDGAYPVALMCTCGRNAAEVTCKSCGKPRWQHWHGKADPYRTGCERYT